MLLNPAEKGGRERILHEMSDCSLESLEREKSFTFQSGTLCQAHLALARLVNLFPESQ